MKVQYVRRFIIALVPVTAILFSYQNCSTGYDTATGPLYDAEGNLKPPAGFSGGNQTTSQQDGSGTASGRSQTQSRNNISGSPTDTGSVAGTESESDNGTGPTANSKLSDAQQCVNRDVSARQRALKSANAFDAAKKFLENRRCNSYLSGPNGQARQLLQEARVENFCLSDIDNTFLLLRQVGRMAGMQDLDHHNAVEKWIDCFCNVTGKAICPEVKAKKAKDVYDIQDHFVDPKHRKPAMKIEDIPLNEDDVSGVDEVLND